MSYKQENTSGLKLSSRAREERRAKGRDAEESLLGMLQHGAKQVPGAEASAQARCDCSRWPWQGFTYQEDITMLECHSPSFTHACCSPLRCSTLSCLKETGDKWLTVMPVSQPKCLLISRITRYP